MCSKDFHFQLAENLAQIHFIKGADSLTKLKYVGEAWFSLCLSLLLCFLSSFLFSLFCCLHCYISSRSPSALILMQVSHHKQKMASAFPDLTSSKIQSSRRENSPVSFQHFWWVLAITSDRVMYTITELSMVKMRGMRHMDLFISESLCISFHSWTPSVLVSYGCSIKNYHQLCWMNRTCLFSYSSVGHKSNVDFAGPKSCSLRKL